MFWGLSEDLINKNNYDEVNKLLDFILMILKLFQLKMEKK